jgi:hypothetical protein
MKANKFLQSDGGYTNLVPLVLSIVIVFALLFVGAYVNGIMHNELDDTLAGDNDNRAARSTMNNTSDNFDSALDIIQVTIIITILATAIGAIFLFTKFR